MSTRDEIKQLLKLLGATFDNFEVSPETISIWFGVLSDLAFEDISTAALQVIKGSREFAPKAGTLRKLAEDLAFARTGTPVNGEQAWDLIKAIIVRNRHDPDKRKANAEAAKIGDDFKACIKAFGYGRIRECVWPATQGRGLTTAEVEQRRRQFLDHWVRFHAPKITTGEIGILNRLGIEHRPRPRLTDGAWTIHEGGTTEPMKIGEIAQKIVSKVAP